MILKALVLTMFLHATISGDRNLNTFLAETNYDKDKLPNNTEPMKVELFMDLYSIREVEKKSFTFKIRAAIYMSWYDSRLVGLESTKIVGRKVDIWMPDIKVANALEINEIELIDGEPVMEIEINLDEDDLG